MPEHDPLLSIIVPAHNEARLLGDTLQAIRAAASGSAYELIVVDDASDDTTATIAAQHAAHVIRVEHRHIAATRNAGARAAHGAQLLFVDADTLIDATVLDAARQALHDGAVGGGARVRLSGREPWAARVAAAFFAWMFRRTGIAPGCFIFCRHDAFDAAGGFDETYFAGEDVAISRALARHGRFVILRESVRTSERKLRSFSVWEHSKLMLRFAVRGRRLLRSREHLELWYGKRRD